MENGRFTTLRWNKKLRAWYPALNNLARLVLVSFALMCLTAATTKINLATQATGILPTASMPALTGDVTSSSGGVSTTVAKLNGISLPTLAAVTGIFYDTNGTLSIAATLPTAAMPALSGDLTGSSGSLSVTVSKINGTTVATNSAADQALITTASGTASWASIPNCGSASQALAYSTGTHTFSCQSVTGANFADDETPTGLINGSNTSYSLAHTPSPAASLSCFKNGQKLEPSGADFTLATATITAASAPATGDILTCNYRY